MSHAKAKAFLRLLAERAEIERATYNQCWARMLNADKAPSRFLAYMVETYHYIAFTCPLLDRLAERLRQSDPELARYLAHHSEEERDHDLWLLRDLERLGLDPERVKRSTPRRETVALIGSQLYAINHAPQRLGHLGYGYALESSPSAPEAADRLADALGLPRAAFSTFRLHCELDPAHEAELEATIARFVTTADEQEAVLANMEMTLRFLSELVLSCTMEPLEDIEAQLAGLSAGGPVPAAVQPSA